MMKLFLYGITMVLYDIVHLSKFTELHKVNFNKCNKKIFRRLDKFQKKLRVWQSNVIVLQIWNNFIEGNEEREGTDLINCRWVGFLRLKVKGIAHKYCSLVYEVFSMEMSQQYWSWRYIHTGIQTSNYQ